MPSSLSFVTSDVEDSSVSFERMEIHSTYAGSKKIREEHFEVHHRTPKSQPVAVRGESQPDEQWPGAEGLGLRMRDIPWLDEDHDAEEISTVNLSKAQRIHLSLDEQAHSRAEDKTPMRGPHVRLPPAPASARGSGRSPEARVRPIERGSPVTFYIEGRPDQCFGRVRSVENGSYTVDVIGGGRKAGLDVVTPCSEADLEKAQISKNAAFRRLSGRPLQPQALPRSTSQPELSDELEVGTPVAFFVQNRTLYGRIRSVHDAGIYSVDLPGGGIKVGVNTATRCSEEKLDKVAKSRRSLVWRMDAWSGYKTRNAPVPQRWPSVSRTPRAVPSLHGIAIAKAPA